LRETGDKKDEMGVDEATPEAEVVLPALTS
jgi:hypothetical protein